MTRLYRKLFKTGAVPGSLDESINEPCMINVFEYNEDYLQEQRFDDIDSCLAAKSKKGVRWINIDGRNASVLRRIGDEFNIHPLVLEDVLNTGQTPKFEDYGQYAFVVAKLVHAKQQGEINTFISEQISFVLTKNVLITFQERVGDVFDHVRERIRENSGRIRLMGPDYLMYALLDSIVDYYFVLMRDMGEELDVLEDQLMDEFKEEMSKSIYHLKKRIIFLRKQIWPLREVLNHIYQGSSKYVSPEVGLFMRDASDHALQVNNTIDAFRDSVSGLHDIYLSLVSNRMNEVMKVLTLFAAIFIPLTFIAGIYGMNFDYIPELHYKYGYFVVWGVMIMVVILMLTYFKRKRWF